MAEGSIPRGAWTGRGLTAALIDAYVSSKAITTKRTEQQADSQSADLPKPLPRQEVLSLKRNFETRYYKLEDRYMPAATLLEELFEQLDQAELRPMALTEVCSKLDGEAKSPSVHYGWINQERSA